MEGGTSASPPRPKANETLFVANFREETTKREDLQMLFEPHGELVRIEMQRNHAYVEFKTVEAAIRARQATNGGRLDQREITVDFVACTIPGTKIGTLRGVNGDVYEGEVKDGKRHGRGVMRHASGHVYDGEWKDDKMHGVGTHTSANGNATEGEWENNRPHGRVTVKGTWPDGKTYVGEVEEGAMHGWGKMTFPSGNVYEGGWREGKQHGKGTVKFASGDFCEGQWVDGKRHGRCTTTKASGEVFDGEFADGQRVWSKARVTSLGASEGKQSERVKCANEQPTKGQRLYDECTLRSAKSQQRRLQRNATVKNCEHCGASDDQYKLRVCSGCNLALYCSAACQKATRRSHQRVCDIISQLPSRDSDELVLDFDREKMVDLDAGLRYATKYMDNMKHLQINLEEMGNYDAIKLSVKRLSSLLKSKKGKLESFFWVNGSLPVHLPGINRNGHSLRKELEGLKQLRLRGMKSDEVRPLGDFIFQQKNTLMVLCLPHLQIDWHKAKTRRTIALAVGACKHLVKLGLQGCVLMDPDLKVMLHDLPNLRILYLRRDTANSHESTDNTCGLIARKCPGLQELELFNHDHLSVRGIRKVFEGCVQLRSFCTTTCKLSSCDIRSLLEVAPQLLCLSLGERDFVPHTNKELDEIIEATGGRTAFRFGVGDNMGFYGVAFGMISAKTREKYQHQEKIVCNVWSKSRDPKVANEWEELL